MGEGGLDQGGGGGTRSRWGRGAGSRYNGIDMRLF